MICFNRKAVRCGYVMLLVLCNKDYVSLVKLRKHNTVRTEINLAHCEEEAMADVTLTIVF